MRFDGRARQWVEEVTGRSVARARRMTGGVSSFVHEVVLADGDRVVLRRTFDEPGLDLGSARAEREVVALGRLTASDLTPRLLAADIGGERCGLPAVLTTRVPGRPWVAPGGLVTAWVDGLAAALRSVPDLAGPASDLSTLAPTEPWLDAVDLPPPWTGVPDAWAWALDVARDGLPPGSADRLVHRDLHPANVLFHRRRLSGIVDWEATCRGPAELDVARCRVQVAFLAGPDAADALLARVADLAPAYGPAWDAVVACELSPWTEELLVYNRIGASLTLAGIRSALDAVVARAAASSSG